jgi:hypothetical protein
MRQNICRSVLKIQVKKPVALLLAVAASLISGSAFAQSSSHSISGQILVNDPYYGYPGQPCNQYRRGYQDIMQGVSIVVKDGGGDIMASLNTSPGINVDTGVETNSSESFVVCVVSIPEFQVPDSDFYVFEFGRRGTVTKSRQEMQASNWKLELSIGGN